MQIGNYTYQLRFIEDIHKYFIDKFDITGNHIATKPCTSVTQFIDEFKEKFDTDYWSKYKAKELGKTQAEILADWKKKNDDSLVKGNFHHNTLEDNINDSSNISKFETNSELKTVFAIKALGFDKIGLIDLVLLQGSIIYSKYPYIYKRLEEYVNDGWSIYAERKIFIKDSGIAGTIDLLLIKGQHFMIFDWKTNKGELKFKSGYYKKHNGVKTNVWVDKKTMMFYPINHIEDCKGSTYTLQLSMYAYMLEVETGLKLFKLCLFHITDDIDKSTGLNIIVEHPIKYWKKEVKDMLKYKDFKEGDSPKKLKQQFPTKKESTAKGMFDI